MPGHVAQSVGHLTCKSGPGFDTQSGHILSFSPSSDSRGAVVSYWRKYVHEVLVNRLGGLNLLRKSVVRLTDRPNMTLGIYCGRKQQHNNNNLPRLDIAFGGILINGNDTLY